MNILKDLGCDIWNNLNMVNVITYLVNIISQSQNFTSTSLISVKCDTNMYVIVFNNYIIRLTLNKDLYLNLFEINRLNHIFSENYQNVERSDVFTNINTKIINTKIINTKNSNVIYVIISYDYLNPIFKFENKEIKTLIEWNFDVFKKYLYDVANGLRRLHNARIEHGDLTPDNIGYRSSTNNFVIFDFL